MQAAISWLEQAAASTSGAENECYEKLGDCFQRKLYHQLTVETEKALKSGVISGPALIGLYTNVIGEVDTKLNALKLVQIAVTVSKQHGSAQQASDFLDNVVARVPHCAHGSAQDAEMATLYVSMTLAHLKLQGGKVGECKRAVDDARAKLDPLNNVDPSVSAAVYWVASQLGKAEQRFGEFYRCALKYLSFVSLSDMDEAETHALAVDLCLSALLGEDVYSFGELLEHPIVLTIEKGAHAWLVDLLRAFNAGDAERYDALCVKYGPELNAQPALVAHERSLREKITIMSLLELVFHLPPDARTVPLSAIGERTKLDLDGVEFLLMKSLSLGLVRGRIDQVKGCVEITWIQPRVLTMAQSASLGERLGKWLGKVEGTLDHMQSDATAVV